MLHYILKHFLRTTYHRLGHRRWPEQTAHRGLEAGGGRPLSVSEPVQTAWQGTPARGERPGQGGRTHIVLSFRGSVHGTADRIVTSTKRSVNIIMI